MKTILSVSLPPELRPALDAEAKRQGRSRSFVVTEAIRQYVARQVQEAFGEASDRTLRDSLALTPTDRLTLADELWQELSAGRPLTKPWTGTFETFDQYERWRTQTPEPAQQ